MPKVGIIQDSRFLEHMPGPTHPEHPRRLRAVYEILEREFKSALVRVPTGPATVADIELVHSPEYIERFLRTSEYDFTMLSPDTPVSRRSYISAFLAVGSAIESVKRVLRGDLNSCFALVRPPGHHALKDRAMGFCIFNNAAIGTKFAQKYFGVERVLIVDWDVHFGNGISEVFYQDPSVFYLSTHRIELFPFLGSPDEMGGGPGLGYNLNIVLPPHISTEDFIGLYKKIFEEIIPWFQPELTIVAAGFDTHASDPIGRLQIHESAFYWISGFLVNELRRIQRERVVLVLEGGYDPLGLSLCVRETLKGLMDSAEKAVDFQTPLAQKLSKGALDRLKNLGLLSFRPESP